MTKSEMITDLRAKRQELAKRGHALIDKAEVEKRSLTKLEERDFARIEQEITEFDQRIDELIGQVEADAASASLQRKYAPKTNGDNTMSASSRMPGRWSVGNEESVYRQDGQHSYFRDLFYARSKGDADAADRLRRNNEQRALTGNITGNGSDFVPPLYLEDQFIAYARPGRVTADLTVNQPLPPGTDQLILPKVNTGSAVAVQTTQNSPVEQQDLTTTSVASPVTTIAGAQTLSLQLIEQSPISVVDQVVLADLAADYAMKLDQQVLSGTGTGGQVTGILTLSGTNQITWSPTGTPTLAGAGGLYSALADGIQQIHTKRFLPATVIIMHPRRWAWLESQSDSANRPYVLPKAGMPLNALGVAGDVVAQGMVGEMLGLPVYVDANIPTNGGTATDQDSIVICRREDLVTWESNVRAEAFQQTYAQNMSVLVRLYNYMSFQPARYPQSISLITGTGLVTPTFE
jgi:HK97 family phage major capsid protein